MHQAICELVESPLSINLKNDCFNSFEESYDFFMAKRNIAILPKFETSLKKAYFEQLDEHSSGYWGCTRPDTKHRLQLKKSIDQKKKFYPIVCSSGTGLDWYQEWVLDTKQEIPF